MTDLRDSLIGDVGFLHASCSPRRAIFIPALPFCHAELWAAKPKSERYPKRINTLGDHIRVRRLDLRLFQRHVAELIGVHPLTITNWEGNVSQPAVQYIPAIIRFLGYDPSPPATSLAERLNAARRARALTQIQLAVALDVNPSTIQHWETGWHEPSPRKREVLAKFLARWQSASMWFWSGPESAWPNAVEALKRIMKSVASRNESANDQVQDSAVLNENQHQESEIGELERMFVAEDPRGKRLRFWRRKLVDTLYVVNLVFIIGVVICLLAVYGWHFFQWLEFRGP